MAWPADPADVHVEIQVDGVWTDIVGDVRGDPGITITRGIRNEGPPALPEPGRATMTLDNLTGTYSNRQPASPYYMKIGRNTPLRVRVGSDVRFYGEVSDWTPGADPSGLDAWVQVEASGILRRINQGQLAVSKPLRLSILAIGSDLAAYWPMTDSKGSSQFAAATPGVRAMQTAGTGIVFASDTSLAGSEALPVLSSPGQMFASFAGTFPTGYDATADGWTITWVMNIPSAPAADTTLLHWWAYGDVTQWYVILTAAGKIVIRGYSSTFVEIFADAGFDFAGSPMTAVYSTPLFWTMYVTHSGGNYTATVNWSAFGTDNVQHSRQDQIIHAGTAGQPWAIDHFGFGASLGHVAVIANGSAPSTVWAAYGYASEYSSTRIARITSEAGVSLTVTGVASKSAMMGPQGSNDLAAILTDCIQADMGILSESRSALALNYRNRRNLYNQAATVALSYSGADLSTNLSPVDDDQQIHNDVTAHRTSGDSDNAGSTVRVTLAQNALNHELSVQAFPNGVGTYDRGVVDANVFSDGNLTPFAYWTLHLGTWNESRYPVLSVQLQRGVWLADATRTAQITSLDIGSALSLDGLPAWLPPDMVMLQVRGYEEKITRFGREFSFNLMPGWPWEVWELDTGGSTLAVAASSGATSLKLATSNGPPWEQTAVPYHIQIDGEAMTVTAMATDTPAFIAAGAIATGNNASVTPALPAGITPDVGQLLLIWAAIRNSGTGTVDLPSGWTSIVDFGNCRLMGRYYLTGDAAPSVTFTGGVANADTSARMFAFSGTSMHPDASATLLNGSAQNMAIPALDVRRTNNVMLALGWKQDDWTSVATLAGFTEDADNPTTTGDDQGIVVDHRIDTTPADLTATSFVVTGGASAISRTVVVALRPLQTATVTRAVNGVTKSLAAGKAAHGWRMGVIAL